MAKLKAEFLQQYYDANGVPFRSKLIANFSASARLGAIAPSLYNYFVSNKVTGNLIKKASGFALRRSMPTLYKTTLKKWFRDYRSKNPVTGKDKKVNLFCDEFTNYNDTETGIKAILLLEKLGYEVNIPDHEESGRTWLSKGLIRDAQKIINRNIEKRSGVVSEVRPLIGIEPSAILTFRDEYIDLATDENLEAAKKLSSNVYFIDEFIAAEAEKGNISSSQFTSDSRNVLLHGHCQQKALSSISHSIRALSIPANYSVTNIPSGCCGMAGSFGFEKEHFDISQQIGELVLFPAVRRQKEDVIIAAPGTSCRHQVKDGTGRKALHPVEILFDALRK
jgi:Fe-S oxidoreductase